MSVARQCLFMAKRRSAAFINSGIKLAVPLAGGNLRTTSATALGRRKPRMQPLDSSSPQLVHQLQPATAHEPVGELAFRVARLGLRVEDSRSCKAAGWRVVG